MWSCGFRFGHSVRRAACSTFNRNLQSQMRGLATAKFPLNPALMGERAPLAGFVEQRGIALRFEGALDASV